MSVALCISAILPLLLPGIGVGLRPALPAMIMAFLVNAFARVDISQARKIIARPYKLLLGLGWVVLAIPAAFWVALTLVGRPSLEPGLILGLSLQAAAAPIMATPAVAMVLDIDVTFSVLLLLATMIVQPFTAPLVAPWVAGSAIQVDGFSLGRNLLFMIGGSLVISAAVRWLVGQARLEKYRFEIGGANLIVFTLFGLAMFDGVVLQAFERPWLVISLSAAAFAVALGSMGAAFVFLHAFGRDDAFITGFAAGHRNVGLMAAAQSGSLPGLTWLYFALLQLPIYLTPLIVRQTLRLWRQGRRVDASGDAH